MFGRMWLGIATVIGFALMVAAIIFISPLLFAVAICVVVVAILFALGQLGSAAKTTQAEGPSRVQGAGSDVSGPESGGRPASGEGRE